MLIVSHSDLTLFSPRAYDVFNTHGNALHLYLSVTILSRSCLYFSHLGRHHLLQLACLLWAASSFVRCLLGKFSGTLTAV